MTYLLKSLYATRMPPTQNILSVHLQSASSSRDAILSTLLYRDTLGGSPPPTPPPGTHPHPTPTHPPHPTPPTPRAPGGGKGPKGAFGALGGNGAHGTLWGHSAAIPKGKPFRMEGDSEWMADYCLAGPPKEYEAHPDSVAQWAAAAAFNVSPRVRTSTVCAHADRIQQR